MTEKIENKIRELVPSKIIKHSIELNHLLLAIEKQAYKEYQSKCNEIYELDIKIIDGKEYKLVD